MAKAQARKNDHSREIPEDITLGRHLPEAEHKTKLANNSAQVGQTTQFQTMADSYSGAGRTTESNHQNHTGLTNKLKSNLENLSGYSMDDVRVHYNSGKPAQLQAHAFAQGTQIHLAPGQEKHLPHEAWHVVQQKQGRVKPTLQTKNKVDVNDDPGLEQEADIMGDKAAKMTGATPIAPNALSGQSSEANVQRKPLKKTSQGQDDITQLVHERVTPAGRNFINVLHTFLGGHIGANAVIAEYVNVVIGAETNATFIAAYQHYVAGHHLQPANVGIVTGMVNTIRAEIAAWNAELDNLLGAGVDPGGIRETLMTNTPVFATFQAASLAVRNAVPQADRVGLLNQVGDSIAELDGLLTDCTSAMGAGTAKLRLDRVLASTPGAVARTQAGLAPFIAAQLRIDEKILRGEITGGPPAPGAIPAANNRNLIGGHSQEITNDPSYVIDNTVNNVATPTDYVSFRKLVRTDANGFAADVNGNVANNIVDAIVPLYTVAANIGAAPPAYPAGPPVNVTNQWALARAPHIATAIAQSGQAALDAAAARAAAAGAVAAGVGNAAGMAPFIDQVVNLYTSAMNALTAAIAVENRTGQNLAAPARALLQAEINRWRQNGPVLSANKNSTFAPPGWTDDDVIRAGDLAAAVPATLVRYNNPQPAHVPIPAPPNGANVESKHQRVTNDPATGNPFVWVVMKANATYNAGPPPSLTGGTVISSYPTNDAAIPAPPLAGNMDADRFSPI